MNVSLMTSGAGVTSELSAGQILAAGRGAVALGVLVRPPRDLRGIARVLALRELAQAALTFAGPTPAALRMGAGVDVLHAGSMVVAAWRWPRQRRLALMSLGLAAGWAAAALFVAVTDE